MATATSRADDLLWQQVVQRTSSADFFYGVLTTGIFCRPGCSSRTPLRKNVRFFHSAEEALACGLRPCQRCKPQNKTVPVDTAIVAAARYLQKHADRRVSLTELARIAKLSASHLQKRFQASMGVSPRQYAEHLRMQQVHTELASGLSITDATYAAGFSSASRLYAAAANHLGMKPGDLKHGAKNVTIHYSTANSPLGRILIATTDTGICAIALADTDAELTEELRARFPHATLLPDKKRLHTTLQQAVAAIGSSSGFDLPLDLRATAFQLRVWNALRKIPRGQTRTYSEVAKSIGQPTATRAVARACATNPVAVAIPCHRVIGSNGTLTGYRWGVERKRKLLALEALS